jgi:hypothetical protein
MAFQLQFWSNYSKLNYAKLVGSLIRRLTSPA